MAIAQFVELNKTPRLLEFYVPRALDGLAAYTRELLKEAGAAEALLPDFTVRSASSLDWTPRFKDLSGDELPEPKDLLDSLTVGCEFDSARALNEFRKRVLEAPAPGPGEDGFLSVGANPGAGSAEHWCPTRATGTVFGRQRDARTQIRAASLAGAGLTGSRVNVLIVDQGLSSAHLPPANYGGGLDYLGSVAGASERNSHGMMVARAVLDIAPDARLFDVPVVPPRIRDVSVSMDTFNSVYALLRALVTVLRALPGFSGPWIIVNAWAVFDRATEFPPGDYTQDGHPLGHAFNHQVELAAQSMDVVFAAGNCGQYCADRRSGPIDRGPGHSIWGANAHRSTVTAGAVRTDDLWCGLSSQGPVFEQDIAPALLEREKPDLAAPSFFRDDLDAAMHYTGTSAACGVTAGAIASLRSQPGWNQFAVTPAVLRDALIESARKTMGPAWSNRTGHGILDLQAAMEWLSRVVEPGRTGGS